MLPRRLNISTGRITDEKSEPGSLPNHGDKFLLIPIVKCLDCPGKLYLARPHGVIEDLSIHLKNKSHRRSFKLRRLIESNTASPTTITALQAIRDRDFIQLQEALDRSRMLDQGATVRKDISLPDTWSTILTHIIGFGDIDILKCVFAHVSGTMPNVAPKGITSLHLACYLDKTDIANLMVQHGASLDAKEYANRTPLDRAMEQGHIDAATHILKQWAVQRNENPLSIACAAGYTEIVEQLLKKGEAVKGHSSSYDEENICVVDSDSGSSDSGLGDSRPRKRRRVRRSKKTYKALPPTLLFSFSTPDVLEEALKNAPAATVRLLLEAGATVNLSHTPTLRMLEKIRGDVVTQMTSTLRAAARGER